MFLFCRPAAGRGEGAENYAFPRFSASKSNKSAKINQKSFHFSLLSGAFAAFFNALCTPQQLISNREIFLN
jgi:hypothetical protein